MAIDVVRSVSHLDEGNHPRLYVVESASKLEVDAVSTLFPVGPGDFCAAVLVEPPGEDGDKQYEKRQNDTRDQVPTIAIPRSARGYRLPLQRRQIAEVDLLL